MKHFSYLEINQSLIDLLQNFKQDGKLKNWENNDYDWIHVLISKDVL